MESSIITGIINIIVSLVNALTKLGEYIMSLFGLQTTINIYGHVINLGGLFTTFLTIIIFYSLMSAFTNYWKYIIIGCFVVVLLSIIGTVFGG